MTLDPVLRSELGSVPTKTMDGRTMIGHVVVCHGRNKDNTETVAVWHVNTAGRSVGAWMMPVNLARPDPEAARKVLQLCLRRAVTAWNPAHALSILAVLEKSAGVTAPPWHETTVAIPEILSEISLTRLFCEKRTTAERQAKKHLVDIEWPVDVPELLPATADGFQQHIKLTLPKTSPVGQEALLLSNLVHWAVQRWQENMTALRRRRYLQRDLGQPSQLPSGWETRLADAYASNHC